MRRGYFIHIILFLLLLLTPISVYAETTTYDINVEAGKSKTIITQLNTLKIKNHPNEYRGIWVVKEGKEYLFSSNSTVDIYAFTCCDYISESQKVQIIYKFQKKKGKKWTTVDSEIYNVTIAQLAQSTTTPITNKTKKSVGLVVEMLLSIGICISITYIILKFIYNPIPQFPMFIADVDVSYKRNVECNADKFIDEYILSTQGLYKIRQYIRELQIWSEYCKDKLQTDKGKHGKWMNKYYLEQKKQDSAFKFVLNRHRQDGIINEATRYRSLSEIYALLNKRNITIDRVNFEYTVENKIEQYNDYNNNSKVNESFLDNAQTVTNETENKEQQTLSKEQLEEKVKVLYNNVCQYCGKTENVKVVKKPNKPSEYLVDNYWLLCEDCIELDKMIRG